MIKTVSKSPDRHKFQLKKYIERCEEEAKQPSQSLLKIYGEIIEHNAVKFDTEESRENNLEYDLLTTDWILAKVRTSESYAQNLYAALCNNDFQCNDFIPILKDQIWGCTWRYAGGIIADMRQEGDYIDWYCSGIQHTVDDEEKNLWAAKKYVPEGTVTEEIKADLKRLGWLVVNND